MLGVRRAANLAREIFAHAGFTRECEPKCIADLAIGLFGRAQVTFDCNLSVPFVLFSNPDRIHLSLDLANAELTMAFGHAIASWWSLGHPEELKEADIESVAIALILPAERFAESAQSLGPSLPRLARAFVCPPEIVAWQLRRLSARPLHGSPRRLSVAS
jgi:hypothetical protein